MSYSRPARTAARRPRANVVAAVVVLAAAIAGAAVYQSQASSSPAVTSPIEAPPSDPEPVVTEVEDGWEPPGEGRGPDRPAFVLGEADGAMPDGATVFDEWLPGVANLDGDLLDALHEAASDAADDGVEFVVNSGWRSAAYQEQLLREAVAEYGSEEEAARWVSTPDTSLHVSGDAVDLGPEAATAWLSEHGAEYGLCQIYENEPWHYELRDDAADEGCPPMYADPTEDPRMQ